MLFHLPQQLKHECNCNYFPNSIIERRVKNYLDSGTNDKSLYQHIRKTMEKPLFEIVLKKTKGNRSKAAEILGINRNTLHVKIEEYGIEV